MIKTTTLCLSALLFAALASAQDGSTIAGEFELSGTAADGSPLKAELKVTIPASNLPRLDRQGPGAQWSGSAQRINNRLYVLYRTLPGHGPTLPGISGALGGHSSAPAPEPNKINMILGEYEFTAGGNAVSEKLTNLTRLVPETSWETLELSGHRASTAGQRTVALDSLAKHDDRIKVMLKDLSAQNELTLQIGSFALNTHSQGVARGMVKSLFNMDYMRQNETGQAAVARLVKELRKTANQPDLQPDTQITDPLRQLAQTLEQTLASNFSFRSFQHVSGVAGDTVLAILIVEDENRDFFAFRLEEPLSKSVN